MGARCRSPVFQVGTLFWFSTGEIGGRIARRSVFGVGPNLEEVGANVWFWGVRLVFFITFFYQLYQ